MITFQLLIFHLNLTTLKLINMWGPSNQPISKALHFDGAPYAPFSKGDKIGKVADWAVDPAKEAKEQKRAQGRGFRDPYHAYGASASSFFTADDSESSFNFSVVDSVRNSGPSSFNSGKQGSGFGKPTVLRARGGQNGPVRTGAAAHVAGAPSGPSGAPPNSRGPPNRGPRTMTIGSATLHNRRGGGGRPGGWQNDKARARKPSVAIGSNWKHIQTNSISELLKLSFNVKEPKDIGEYGYVQLFDRQMEKLTTTKRLRHVDVTEYNVSTSEDPIIRAQAKTEAAESPKPEVQVFATDAIIALLMCAPKSNNPWDVIVTKKDGQIFFDKRDNSALDLPSVDENAMNPPLEVSDSKIDSASALSLEASYVNLNFEANVVKPDAKDRVSMAHPNPFSQGDEPANAPLLPKAYIYKEFNLESNPDATPIPLVVRMEIDAAIERDGKKELATVFALNEYGGASKQLEWKDRFSSHRGAIVAAEMKNNLNKLSQWTARSLLAGVSAMKIGFVSRINPRDNQTHEIINVLNAKPDNFAQQLNLSMLNGWGIIKSLVDVFANLDDGKFVLLRDPVMPSVSIYAVPEETTFEDA